MADTTFAQFTLESSPAVTDFLVGYRTAVSGGERRTTISSLATVLGTVLPASIAGTANQISASASVGAVTLSLAGPHNFTSLTSTAVLLGAGTSAITPADLSYSTPTLTVPASFGITGAGSLAFTAGGSNQNITLTPSGTGQIGLAVGTGYVYVGTNDLPGAMTDARFVVGNSGAGSAFGVFAYGGSALTRYAGALGTLAAPLASSNGNTLGGFTVAGYTANGAGNWSGTKAAILVSASENWSSTNNGTQIVLSTTKNATTTRVDRLTIANDGALEINLNASSLTAAFAGAHITAMESANTGFTVDTFGALGIFNARRANGTRSSPTALVADDQILNFGARGYGATAYSSGSKGAFVIQATENWTDSIQSTHARIDLTPRGSSTAYTPITFGLNRMLSINDNAATVPFTNWSLSGVALRITPSTYTNTSSSGTVAGLAMSSIGIQTVAATSTTTFTDAANLYIAGDVAAGTNVTLTNSYGLWNVGKTRLDGLVGIGAGFSSTTQLNLPASTTGVSTLRIPHGSAPSSPVNGDMWTTTAGLFVRINGATVGPLS